MARLDDPACGQISQVDWIIVSSAGGRQTQSSLTCLLSGGASVSLLPARLPRLPQAGLDLIRQLLCYNPSERITAEAAFEHAFFRSVHAPRFLIRSSRDWSRRYSESPLPKHPSAFPSFPSLASGEKSALSKSWLVSS